MTQESVGNVLAAVNATLNLTSGVLLLTGFRFIKQKKTRHHKRVMLGAVTASSLFLIFYMLRISLTGTHRFGGGGLAKDFYLALLFSHMTLAAGVVPFVVALLYLALRQKFPYHARLARWVFPVWLYVSVSGFLVYLLLYHIFGYA